MISPRKFAIGYALILSRVTLAALIIWSNPSEYEACGSPPGLPITAVPTIRGVSTIRAVSTVHNAPTIRVVKQPAAASTPPTEEISADATLRSKYRSCMDEAEPASRFELAASHALLQPQSPAPGNTVSNVEQAAAHHLTSKPSQNSLPSTVIARPAVRHVEVFGHFGQVPAPADDVARHSNLRLTALRADELTQYGFELGQRGAHYSAEAQFIRALKLVAEALDAEQRSDVHLRATVAGLLAIEEADDFAVDNPKLVASVDVADIVSTHRTPVLQDASLCDLHSLAALQSYYQFAQEQLIAGAGGRAAASRALYGLARIHTCMGKSKTCTRRFCAAKAMVLQRTALTVDDTNFRAANELGVLLARHGQYDEALEALLHSLSVSPQPETFYNLSVIYGRRHDTEKAKQARLHSESLRDQLRRQIATNVDGASPAGTMIRWVSHEEFEGVPGFLQTVSASDAVEPLVDSASSGENSKKGFLKQGLLPLPAWHLGALLPGRRSKSSDSQPSVGEFEQTAAEQHVAQLSTAEHQESPVRIGSGVEPVSGTYASTVYTSRSHAEEIGPGLAPPSDSYMSHPGDPACAIHGVRCRGCCGELGWNAMGPIPWQVFAQGEYVGPARLPHVPQYRLRVDDILEFVYRLDGVPSSKPYELEVGDQISIESLTASEIDREVIVQPDGKITLHLLGQVRAAGRNLADLRSDLEERYREQIQRPNVSITPITVNSTATELIATVDRRFGVGGQALRTRVTPEGTVQLPAIGSVPAQGLTLDELKYEIERRYLHFVSGLEVTPVLAERAPRFIYVVGEVRTPGRFTLEAPTTVMQSIALAGSWNVGANLNNVIVFRRDENWQLMATRLDIRGALYGRRPCPSDEIWLRDSDIIVVPKSPILCADDVIELLFTRGLYGVIPIDYTIQFTKLGTL